MGQAMGCPVDIVHLPRSKWLEGEVPFAICKWCSCSNLQLTSRLLAFPLDILKHVLALSRPVCIIMCYSIRDFFLFHSAQRNSVTTVHRTTYTTQLSELNHSSLCNLFHWCHYLNMDGGRDPSLKIVCWPLLLPCIHKTHVPRRPCLWCFKLSNFFT